VLYGLRSKPTLNAFPSSVARSAREFRRAFSRALVPTKDVSTVRRNTLQDDPTDSGEQQIAPALQ
jgi:hypothetical protein